ncbi:MAG: imidazole glycerol phosphate synthase subunit HisH [Candidatus Rokuibacteriota bacterium]|nr:MAG: imidazole glycerol phosphate synthase subunit HisH [Candidatus Rokubacteria bacterium]
MIAIIDYGRGNLGSVEKAFARVGVLLGICLGYQLLFTSSEEFGEGRGLDVIPGVVRRFPSGRKVPHMGWNGVEHGGRLRLFEGVPEGARFYFVHSYYPEARTTDCATTGAGPLKQAWCEYGVRFAAAVELGAIHATQFHPEKSQRWGLRMLENFAAIVKDSA